MGADFPEYDGDVPGGLEAGGGWFRGWRLGVSRGGAKEDNQPHCFNLSRAGGTSSGTDHRRAWSVMPRTELDDRRQKPIVCPTTGRGLLVAARRWWGRWSGRRAGPGPGPG